MRGGLFASKEWWSRLLQETEKTHSFDLRNPSLFKPPPPAWSRFSRPVHSPRFDTLRYNPIEAISKETVRLFRHAETLTLLTDSF